MAIKIIPYILYSSVINRNRNTEAYSCDAHSRVVGIEMHHEIIILSIGNCRDAHWCHFICRDMSDIEEFSDVDAGASNTEALKAGKIRKGDFIVINGKPCKVAEVSTSKTGKHGHAKATIVGIDIFTGKKYETICPTSHSVETPVIKREEWQVTDMDDEGFLTLMNDANEEKVDCKAEESMIPGIREALDKGVETVLVTVCSAMDTEKVMDWKTIKE